MIRTQVYITEQEKKALTQLTLHTGESQSELIRKAIDLLCQLQAKESRAQLMRSAKGIWKNRTNDDDFIAIRNEMDRDIK
ncbi:MAG: ribbon-helix-helix protein, CopG family [Gammaproteobacteria bacterium]|nr:ribbon-helix-helix protein, CopG family [Gammaproteobacteria bacterium]